MNLKILYPVIDGEITGGNVICLEIIEESLRRGYGVVVNSPTEGKFISLLKGKGIRVYSVDTRRTFRLDSAIKLVHIIKKEGVNLIHSHTPLSGIILSRLAGRIAGVPAINHAHLPDIANSNPVVRFYHFLLNWITTRLFYIKIIAVSKSVRAQIIKQGVAPNKIVVVYNGIGLDESLHKENSANIREEFGLKQNQQIIGEVARLCRSKGQHILIKAAQKVIKNFPETVFMIIGEDLEGKGQYRRELKSLAAELGVERNFIFTGYRSDIRILVDNLDLLVLPSLIEGLPVVVLEAMAAKKAVIITSVGGNPEIVIDGLTGTLIPPQDPDKLAEAIIYHLENPQISKEMGEKGYERVRQYFSLSEMLDKVMEIYRDVARRK